MRNFLRDIFYVAFCPALVAAPLLFLTSVNAFAGGEAAKTVQECAFFSTRMVMSTSSGALGHIVTGELVKGKCYYDVRLHLNSQLVTIKGMRDYELAWAPEKKKEAAIEAPNPAKYVENLDFGS